MELLAPKNCCQCLFLNLYVVLLCFGQCTWSVCYRLALLLEDTNKPWRWYSEHPSSNCSLQRQVSVPPRRRVAVTTVNVLRSAGGWAGKRSWPLPHRDWKSNRTTQDWSPRGRTPHSEHRFPTPSAKRYIYKPVLGVRTVHSSEAVWESRWPSWAVRPNEPSVFRGRKAILNDASALVSACP